MPLSIFSKQNCNVLLAENRCSFEVAKIFNPEKPEREPINAWSVRKLIQNFRATGSVHDKQRSGCPSNACDSHITTGVLAAVMKSTEEHCWKTFTVMY